MSKPIVVLDTAFQDVEEGLLDVCGSFGLDVRCVCALFAVLGVVSGLQFKGSAAEAWKHLSEHWDMRRLFVSRFDAIRALESKKGVVAASVVGKSPEDLGDLSELIAEHVWGIGRRYQVAPSDMLRAVATVLVLVTEHEHFWEGRAKPDPVAVLLEALNQRVKQGAVS